MNEHIKTFCLIVITACVFVMAMIDVLELIQSRQQGGASARLVSKGQVTAEQLEAMPKTSIHFDQLRHDFGEIIEGQKVKHSFSFVNTGTAPLVIASATGSCGCTVPTFSKEPIPPGGTGRIDVEFDSSGRVGKNSKTVTVNANTDPNPTVLFILADVKPRS
ncbi:MAG: DUF1573 domain-containing protein [Chitinophagales bacterium]|nr:DUF1573 domain-containing protein [Chitinophagales bacterium]MDW8393750.1 DUF1573 domain-containing protein [Chitinophagales bacterium]